MSNNKKYVLISSQFGIHCPATSYKQARINALTELFRGYMPTDDVSVADIQYEKNSLEMFVAKEGDKTISSALIYPYSDFIERIRCLEMLSEEQK